MYEKEPSKNVAQKRAMRAARKLSVKERPEQVKYSELKKDIMIWEGTVYEPRGMRRKLLKILNSKIN